MSERQTGVMLFACIWFAFHMVAAIGGLVIFGLRTIGCTFVDVDYRLAFFSLLEFTYCLCTLIAMSQVVPKEPR